MILSHVWISKNCHCCHSISLGGLRSLARLNQPEWAKKTMFRKRKKGRTKIVVCPGIKVFWSQTAAFSRIFSEFLRKQCDSTVNSYCILVVAQNYKNAALGFIFRITISSHKAISRSIESKTPLTFTCPLIFSLDSSKPPVVSSLLT